MREMYAPYLFLSASLLVAELQEELSLILQDIGLKFNDLLLGKLNNRNKKTQGEKVHTLQTMNLGKGLSLSFHPDFTLILHG